MLLNSFDQAWPPFVLVIGLLLVGHAANGDGLFAALGARIAAAPLSPLALFSSLLALVAAVTVVLNLDTSVVFMTPVLVHAARRRGMDERPFLYGSVFMSNSASLLLPGSNLTNLLVTRGRADGLEFAREMLPVWIAACVLTVVVLALAFDLRGASAADRSEQPSVRGGVGAVSVALAALLVLMLPSPALPVLALGLAATLAQRRLPRIGARVLGSLFALTVALGVLARAYDGPAELLGHADRWSTAALAGLAANLVNNLPAAVLFSAQSAQHPRALLLGLDLGPNLAVTGSLSAFLWFQAARAVGARPSVRAYSGLGLVLTPLCLAVTTVLLFL